MAYDEEIKIRSYNWQIDQLRIEDLERRCTVGLFESGSFLYTDTMGDPICRIRNCPMYNMLVAEADNEIVGVIQGTIKTVTLPSTAKDKANVGYILGLRVSPLRRRKNIGSSLVLKMEQWFITNNVDFAYMATEKDNKPSVKLFTCKLGYVPFRRPTILVDPVARHKLRISSKVEIAKIKIEQAEYLYRRFVVPTAEFFSNDMDKILRNKLSLGTWIAYPSGESWNTDLGSNAQLPSNWAMLSVWNSVDVFKLRVSIVSMPRLLCAKSSKFIKKLFPCLKVPIIPDFFQPFGFYFTYGMHCEGERSDLLMRSLCRFVHNLATQREDCKVIVTEVGECDKLRALIPHSRLLSCPEDLWCIKALKVEEKHTLLACIRAPPPKSLFVDPREV
ncbi:hypothetical protein IFM89_012264 [Coptis chinensis]|uniref:N-acetyltransferase domain-containing protein n=1 Tax=Coptis chinensis TaxID=261450 RepID=A0A835HGN6_9MAGN|nr:hypothetical protein IFM89_012264 [Coptis chinensis]